MPRPSHWKHDRDYFYKYVSADVARLILQNRTLRWSQASAFNDPFDVGFDLHIEYDPNGFAERATSRIIEMLADPARQSDDLARLLRERPDIPRDWIAEFLGVSAREIAAAASQSIPTLHAQLNQHLRNYRILCLAATFDQILMWSHYASNHTGAVIELRCDEEIDSSWSVALPVRYRTGMPRLVDETGFIDLLLGVGQLDAPSLLHDMIYTKAVDWSYEQEYRIHVPGNRVWQEFVGFNPKELSGVYFGCRTTSEDIADITNAAVALNNEVRIFRGKKSERQFAIDFERFR